VPTVPQVSYSLNTNLSSRIRLKTVIYFIYGITSILNHIASHLLRQECCFVFADCSGRSGRRSQFTCSTYVKSICGRGVTASLRASLLCRAFCPIWRRRREKDEMRQREHICTSTGMRLRHANTHVHKAMTNKRSSAGETWEHVLGYHVQKS
jgi:hypothetical protein